ncbi:MAG TPA: efflux RND transporter permease subunit, partial [Chloroflexia bacterium]|nr:efflux RND transporter permease subunit [Chloroflexia bacterium]
MTILPPPRLRGNPIADTAIRQPIFILMLMMLALVVGGVAYTTLPVNLLPDIDVPTVAVTLPYPGANAESVVDQVVRPVEDQVATLSGVKHVTSTASEGAATLVIEFENSTNVNQALQDVRDKVNATLPRLPRDLKTPIYQKFDPNQQPILSVAITGAGRSPLQLRTLVDNEIVPRLEQVSGVGAVTSSGGQVRQINVLMDGQQLAVKRLVPAQIAQAIDAANASQSLGTIHTGSQDFDLRAPSMLATPADIGQVQITGTPYRVGDVATVEDGVAETSGYARLNGQDAVVVDVRRQSGTNLVQVVDAARTQLTDLFARYPDLHYAVVSDQSTRVRESVDGSIEELILAVFAAMLVVLLFFRDLRNTLVTVSGLPIILIASFAAMAAFGITLNLISLLALSVSVGLVIDDAIVVRENIFRHMERGESPMPAASRGTAQVALSVLAMTLTLIAVFLPVAFTGGVTGIIFKAFGLTVASAMALSLVEAFTLAPMLSAHLFKGRPGAATAAAARPRSAQADLLAEAAEDP